jgi:hypothetical protein
MTDVTDVTSATDLVTNLESRLAYAPLEGRMWRTDAAGTPLHELATWHFDEDRGIFVVGSIWISGLGTRRANRVIYFLMTGEWPLAAMLIHHRNRDPSDNRWANLRLCTPSENNCNVDHSGQRWHARRQRNHRTGPPEDAVGQLHRTGVWGRLRYLPQPGRGQPRGPPRPSRG